MKLYFISVFLLISGAIISIFLDKNIKMKFCAAVSFLSAIFAFIPAFGVIKSGETLQSTIYLPEIFHEVSFIIDPLSAFFVLMISIISSLGVTYGIGYIKPYLKENTNLSAHTFFLMMLIASMLTVVVVQNILFFLVVWEIMSLSSFFLVIFEGDKKEVLKAGIKYLVYMHISVLFIMAAFAVLNLKSGSLNFSDFASVLYNDKELMNIVFILFFIGFGTKAGLIPFHNWLPDAHPVAPTHVSGIMSGVMIKTGIYGILRIVSLIVEPSLFISYTVLTTGILTALWGILYAVGQYDIKKMLAYSSMENIGIIITGLGTGLLGQVLKNPFVMILGYSGCILHILNHSIFKTLLFCGAGAVYTKTHTKNMELLGGLMKKMPYTGLFFTTGAVSICALPPFNGFISEFLIYAGIIKGIPSTNITSFMLLVAVLAALALVGTTAILCFTKTVGITFLGQERSENAKIEKKDVSKIMLIPMGILALFTLLIGIFPAQLFKLVIQPVSILMQSEIPDYVRPVFDVTEYLSFLFLIFVLIIGFVFALKHFAVKNTRVHKVWGCGYNGLNEKMQYSASSYSDLFVSTLKPLFKRVSHIKKPKTLFPKDAYYETEIEDIEEAYIVKPLVKLDEKFLSRFEKIQNGNMQQYILFGLVFLILAILGVICWG